MAEQEVTWVMHLKDMFTSKIKDADKAAQHLEGTMHSAGNAASSFGTHIFSAISAAAAAFEGFEFVKSSVEDFHHLEEANAQLKAGLQSTGYAAGISFDELEKGSISFAEQFKVTRGEISDMQAQLLTFPGVTKATFNDASQSIIDMSTRLHKDLNQTAIMVGKALQDPAKGITALRKVGVNFNEEQTKIIKNLVKTGHAGEAQKRILTELQTEFAGSAKAAADSDPLFRYHKIMEDIKLSVGGAAMELIKFLAPAITWVAGTIKDSITWLKQHKDLVIAIGIAVGAVTGVLLIYEGVMKYHAIANKIATVTQWALNAAQAASPLTWMVIGLTAVVAAVIYCYKHFATFRAVLLGVWETIKEFGAIASDTFMGLYHVIHGVLNRDWSEISHGLSQEASAIFDAGKRLGNAFQKGYNNGLVDFAKDHQKGSDSVAPTAIIAAGGGGKPPKQDDKPPKTETAKASGSKNVSIHVTINGGLVHGLEYHVTNMKESLTNLRDHVTAALLSAVADSQIVVEH